MITRNGNIGIGITNPSEKLEVSGSIKATSFVKSGGTSTQFLMADGSVNSNTYVKTDGTNASGTWGINITGNAATASMLQTARNINGTSFNGSADITTSTWGTSRTITIGATGKTVDGSANVAWTLAEIGAQASLVTSTTATGITNDTTGNTNTYLNITQNGASPGSSTQITGAGSVTVSSDAAGKLTITGTDTNTTYSAGTGLTLTGTVFTPTFGTTAGTVAQGNDSRIINGQTAYGWGNHTGLYIPVGQKGVANGVATLDASGLIPTTQLPSYVDDVIEAADLTALNALPAGDKQTGKIYVALDTNKSYRWSGSTFIYITSGAVDSVAGKTGVVTLVKGDVGLGNVDNTSDSTKSVASAAKLTTARTIGGVSFDGTANINLPGVNTAGNQNTTGNAATATTLQTARTLTIGNTGKTFNGSANVAWSLSEIGAQAALTNPITGTATSGQVAFFNGTTTQTGDTNLFWDNTNKRLGIGATSPAEKLDVNGNIRATSFIKSGGTSSQFLKADGSIDGTNYIQTLSTSIDNTGRYLSISGGNQVRIDSRLVHVLDSPNRNPNDPIFYPNVTGRSVRFDFIAAPYVSGTGNYAGVMTFSPWDGTTNSTGDSSYQLAFYNQTGINGSGIPGLKIRKGIDTTWNNWYKIYTDGDFSQSHINNWNTAFGWGNHASAGYALASGTVNYIPKFTASGTIGNSQIFDNGTNVGIGTTSPSTLLDVNDWATFLVSSGNRLKIWDGTDNIPTISADNLLVLDSPNIQFYATDVTDSNNNSIYLKLKTVNGNVTIDNTYHNKIVRITASCTITIPNNLRTDFNCTFEVIGAYTAQFVDGSGATTSAPFGRYLKTDLTAMFYCTGTSSNYRLNGSLATS